VRAGFDNNILVWGTRKDLDPVDDHGRDIADLQRRARVLFLELERKSIEVVIPEIVISEYLCGVPLKDHNAVISTFHERFFCQPFDALAAAISASLFFYSRSLDDELRRPKRLLKIDTMVVASAKAAICTVFYSNDERCRKLAQKAGMVAHDLPTHSSDLLVNLEAREAPLGLEFPATSETQAEDLPPFKLE
jgi:predicted nucleic acid-binding protein